MKIFSFLEVKFSIYLNRRVFVMVSITQCIFTLRYRTDRPGQTVYTQIRVRRTQQLIRVKTVYHSSSRLQNGLFQFFLNKYGKDLKCHNVKDKSFTCTVMG